MKRTTKLVLGLAAATAVGGILTVPVLAHGTMRADWRGGMHQGQAMMGGAQNGEMMGDAQGMMAMMRMHGQMMNMHQGAGMMPAMMQDFDTDGDGQVTPEEAQAGLQALLEKYDADGNGTLSLDEFEALHNDAARDVTVDRFQWLDDDGDGQITADEIAKPADMMARMQSMGQMHGDSDGEHSGKSMMDDN